MTSGVRQGGLVSEVGVGAQVGIVVKTWGMDRRVHPLARGAEDPGWCLALTSQACVLI